MTQTLAKQPRRTAPATRRVSHPSSSGQLFLSCFSLSQTQSSSSINTSPSSSFPSLCIVFLLAFSFLQTPHLTTAKAVIKSEGNVPEETVAISSPTAHVSSPCGGDGGRDDTLIQRAVVEELRTKMSKYHGLEQSAGLAPNTANLLNGTHPEGRKVRQRLRNLVRSRSLMAAGITAQEVSSLEGLLLPTHGSQVEKYTFYSTERDLQTPVQASTSVVSENEPFSVLTFNMLFRVPQEVYNDLIIKSIILRMRISRFEANLCRKLTSLGFRLTASIYLLERNRLSNSLETNMDKFNGTLRDQPKFLKSIALRPDSDNLVTVEIDTSLLQGLIDSENGAVSFGLKVQTKKLKHKTEKLPPELASLTSKKLVNSKREFKKSVSPFIPPPSPSLSLLKKLFPSSSTSSNKSSSSSPLWTPSGDSPDELTFSASLLVSEASLEINFITADLRYAMEAKSRTRRASYRGRYRGRSRSRGRGCRGGYCCPRSTNINITGDFRWSDERHFIMLGPVRINYCSGRCRAGYNTGSNLGQFLSQLHRRHPKEIPSPSCIPDKLGPLEVYVLDSNGYPEPREFPNMMIKSCKCI